VLAEMMETKPVSSSTPTDLRSNNKKNRELSVGVPRLLLTTGSITI